MFTIRGASADDDWPLRHRGAGACIGLAGAQETGAGVRGDFSDDNALFVGLLLGVIIITGGLIYFPADNSRSFIEHLQMQPAALLKDIVHEHLPLVTGVR